MMNVATILVSALLTALGIIFVVARLGIYLSYRIKLVDYPGAQAHKVHLSPKPIAGGIILVTGLLSSALLFRTGYDPDIRVMVLAALIVFAFGLWDDALFLSPVIKVFGQLLAIGVLIWLDVYVKIFESPGFFVQLPAPYNFLADWLVTAVWVIGVTNAFNLIDSMDGLAVGLGGIASAFFMLLSLEAGQEQLALQFVLLLGICLGLYFYNSPPAKFFLGDSGAQTLGFVLAVLAIIYRPVVEFQMSSWLVPILVLGLPIFDTSLVVFSRLRRGKPVYRSGLDHTYHRLVARGMESSRAVLTIQFAALILGCLAYIALHLSPIAANIILTVCLLTGIGLVAFFDNKKRWL